MARAKQIDILEAMQHVVTYGECHICFDDAKRVIDEVTTLRTENARLRDGEPEPTDSPFMDGLAWGALGGLVVGALLGIVGVLAWTLVHAA